MELWEGLTSDSPPGSPAAMGFFFCGGDDAVLALAFPGVRQVDLDGAFVMRPSRSVVCQQDAPLTTSHNRRHESFQ